MTEFRNIDLKNRAQKVHVDFSMRLLDDGTAGLPDSHDEGFWPSNDENACGYVLPENYESEMRKAKARMAAFKRGAWRYVGVVAHASILIPIGGNSFRIMEMDSAGLWGIESDSGDYLKEVYEEEKAELISQLKMLGEALSAA